MPATVTITKSALIAACVQWETESRAGETKTYEEVAAMPLAQVAAENADHLWALLGGAGG